jgi:outer membrane protein TolC
MVKSAQDRNRSHRCLNRQRSRWTIALCLSLPLFSLGCKSPRPGIAELPSPSQPVAATQAPTEKPTQGTDVTGSHEPELAAANQPRPFYRPVAPSPSSPQALNAGTGNSSAPNLRPPAHVNHAEATANTPTRPLLSESLVGEHNAATPFRLTSHLESQFNPATIASFNPATALQDNPAADSADLKETVEEAVQSESADGTARRPLTEALPPPAMRDDAAAKDEDEEKEKEANAARPRVPPLFIEDVVLSATESFPAIREVAQLRTIAIGTQISALGEFDDKLEGYTINQPLGFYENYRHGIALKRPLIMGGTAYTGYRIGDGSFEPWYGERETDEGGEFKVGIDIPLLQNRAIDPRRTAVRLASLDVQRASPELYQQVLTTQFEAAGAYWVWVASAKQYEISLELMELAEQRVEQIQKQIDLGDVAPIVGIDNRRLLALRRAKLIESRQKLDASAIKLSLYFRDGMGRPTRPVFEARPKDFPPLPTDKIDEDAEIRRAVTNRPELAILGIIEAQTRAELRLAINQRLPEISFGTEISHDVGGAASSKRDKGEMILEAGLIGSVPIQRRKAIGKAQSLRGKLAQIDAKRQLTTDKIVNDVRQAITMYEAAILRLEQAKLTKELALQTLKAGEIAFTAGDIDILLLNIYEQAYADAGVDVIAAQAELFTAEAMLMTATGVSLLEDINALDALPRFNDILDEPEVLPAPLGM